MATNHTIRILSIDPGITVTGWACSSYSQNEDHLHVLKYGHIQPSQLSKVHKADCKVYGNQIISLNMLDKSIQELLTQYKPDYIVSEDAFLHPGRVNAYASLKLCIHTMALVCYRNDKVLFKMAPCDIKKAVTGTGKADKDLIQRTVLSHPKISIKLTSKSPDPLTMVEHEADAIAIGRAFANHVLDIQ